MARKVNILLVLVIIIGIFLVGCQHKHTYDVWTTLKEATDYEEGLEEGVCIDCGEVTQRVTKALISNGSNGIIYELSEDSLSYIATDYEGDDSEIVIGSYYCGLPVIGIGDFAFNGCSSLTTITIPSSVTSIGANAFYCDNLVNIRVDKDNPMYRDMSGNLYTKDGKKLIRYAIGKSYSIFSIPEDVTSIGDGAFAYSYKLKNVVIPDGITEIGEDVFAYCILDYTYLNRSWYLGNANNPYLVLMGVDSSIETFHIIKDVKVMPIGIFENCDNLKNITIDEENQNYKVIDDVLYTKDGKRLLHYPRQKVNSEFNIPNGVEVITKKSFSFCESLFTITMPNDVKIIEERAFSYCRNITSISLSDKLESIGTEAFCACAILPDIIIPETVTYIGDRAFFGCKFTNVEIPGNVTTMGRNVFLSCDFLANIDVAESNQSYKDIDGVLYTKDGKSLIKYPVKKKGNIYIIPSGVLKIEDFAFEECKEISEVIFPEGLHDIGERAFNICTSLKSVSVSKGLVSIGPYAFFDCEKLENIILPKGVTTIGNEAFGRCVSLTTFNIPSTVTFIGNSAFYGCTSLSKVNIPNSVTNIGYCAFEGCTGLSEIRIPSSVISIGFNAFFRCDNLIIYCSILTKPEGWSQDWNASNRPVIWGIF